MSGKLTKHSQRRELDPFIGGGTVGYCNDSTCNIGYGGLKLPNGLVYGRDGFIYVPSALDGIVQVFNLSENHLLVKVNEFKVPLPVDNLSVDKKGDIYAAGFPKVYLWTESSKDPFRVTPPSAVFRIRKSGQEIAGENNPQLETNTEYGVEKVMEDDGSLLPGSTTVVHDAETGRIFLSGIMSPYIAICETNLHG